MKRSRVKKWQPKFSLESQIWWEFSAELKCLSYPAQPVLQLADPGLASQDLIQILLVAKIGQLRAMRL